jgi:hypothetical protein
LNQFESIAAVYNLKKLHLWVSKSWLRQIICIFLRQQTNGASRMKNIKLA